MIQDSKCHTPSLYCYKIVLYIPGERKTFPCLKADIPCVRLLVIKLNVAKSKIMISTIFKRQ